MSNTQLTNQQMEQQFHQAMQNTHIIPSDILFLFIVVSILVYTILFSCSLQKTMSRVPVEKRMFPNWFIWIRLVPIAGLIFGWLMLPFGIPGGLRNAVSGNQVAENEANKLKMIGLALLISQTVLLFLNFIVNDSIPKFVVGILVIISFTMIFSFQIIYWINIVTFRKKYLE